MHKNFLLALGLLTLILGHTAVGLPYDDDKGRSAPAAVRRAADEMTAYWGRWQQYYKAETTMQKVNVPNCCFGETSEWKTYHVMLGGTAEKPAPGAWGLAKGSRWTYSESCNQAQADAALPTLEKQWKALKRVVNENVAQGAAYEGDVKLPLGFNMWSDGWFRLHKPIEATVMEWVNAHGGWRQAGDVLGYVVTDGTGNPLFVAK
jgi:hypothetical protein